MIQGNSSRTAGSKIGPSLEARYRRARARLVLRRVLIRQKRLKSAYQVGRPAQTKITQYGRGDT
jgi:hypothetical protein